MDPTDFARAYQQALDLDDTAASARALGELLESVPDLQKIVRTARQERILTLRATGMTDVQIAEALGITWARVSAIARGVSAGGNDAKRRRPAQ